MKKQLPKNKDYEGFKNLVGQYHIKIGEHVFVIKSVKVLNVGLDGKYGDPYTSICDFDIIDGEAHITGLLTLKKQEFTRGCARTFSKFARMLGIKKGNWLRKKNGKDNHKKFKAKL